MSLDGTLDAAAAAIDQIPQNEIEKDNSATPQRESPRAADGKFAKADEPAKEAEAKPDADAKTEPDDADDETYIELPPEAEGKEATRLRLAEVIDGYKKAQTLEADLAKAREVAPPPEIWDQQIIQAVQTRQQLMSHIEKWARVNQPQPPDITLLDPNNINHNPDLYFQQHRQFQALQQAHAKAEQDYNQLAQQQRSEQEAIYRVQLQREMAKLNQVWPELQEESVADKVRADLKSYYGLTKNVIDSVSDAGFFALAKDALAYRAQQATAKSVAKVVAAKPKLIPGKARASTNSATANHNAAFGRLQKSGSIDDAASAIASLL